MIVYDICITTVNYTQLLVVVRHTESEVVDLKGKTVIMAKSAVVADTRETSGLESLKHDSVK